MAAPDHLSEGQFADQFKQMKAEFLSKRGTGEPNSMGRIHPERPSTMFHGTSASLKRGDLIRSASQIGHEGNWPGVTEDVEGHGVFATGDITEGYHFGSHAAHKESAATGDYYGAIPSPHVYEVQHTGRVHPDPEVRGEDFNEGGQPSYRSRQPLRVGDEVSRGAKAEWMDNFGSDWQPRE